MARGKKTGGGSRKGIPNKFTRSIKEAFEEAFEQNGGVKALAEWGEKNPTEFYRLVAKMIPLSINHGGSIHINAQEFDHAFGRIFGAVQAETASLPESVVN